jgi:putative nucleotidyltransferase with HDIG domain
MAQLAAVNGGPAQVSERAEALPKSNAERLAAALDSVEQLPVLGAARDRVLDLASGERAVDGALAEGIESDVALTAAVLRAASAVPGDSPSGVPAAVQILGQHGVRIAALSLPSYEPLEAGHPECTEPERLRLHAAATRSAAAWIGQVTGSTELDQLAAAAILHDIGRVAIERLWPDGNDPFTLRAATPEARVVTERRELGIDHAIVGGVLARRWRLAPELASAVELHHSDEAEGLSAQVKLADMLAHYLSGRAVSRPRLLTAARRAGVGEEGLRRAMHELPLHGVRPRSPAPCPLSGRELDVVRLLADGKVYKEIARELELSASTVRTHLHNVYGKLGAVDRAQAVLIARDRGWL